MRFHTTAQTSFTHLKDFRISTSSKILACVLFLFLYFYDNKFDAIAQVSRKSYMYIYDLVSI